MISHIKFYDYDKSLVRKLVAFKFVTLLVSIAVLFATSFFFAIELATFELAIAVALSAVILLLWLIRLKTDWPVSEIEVFCLLLTDVVFIYSLVNFSGASSNPFTSSLLVPIALGVALLRKPLALAMVMLGVSGYAYWVFAAGGHVAHMNHGEFSLHLYGMWVNFLLSSLILFVFITYAMDSLRGRELQLQQAREKILQDERMIALATHTASTAHALATPLATMTILVEEWERDGGLGEEQQLFKEQLEHCKNHLQSIGRGARSSWDDDKKVIDAQAFVDKLQQHYQLLQPAEKVMFSVPRQLTGRISQNDTLLLAVVNLIENALHAGSTNTQVEFLTRDQKLLINVCDNGPGLPADMKKRLGKTFVNSSREGWGLGVYLSNSTVEQFGGQISLKDREGGGTEVSVVLPLI